MYFCIQTIIKGIKSLFVQLPLYGNPYPPSDVILNQEPGYIESGLRATREALAPSYDFTANSVNKVRDTINTGLAHTKSVYDRISDEDGSSADKAVAIVAGGLIGLTIASIRRRGFFKRLLYISAGSGALTAACYPKQTNEIVEISSYIARKKGPELVKEYTGYDVSPYVPGGVPQVKRNNLCAHFPLIAYLFSERQQWCVYRLNLNFLAGYIE